MSTDKDTGGAAFPCERDYGEKLDSSEGMTLRDYFAAKAMQGLIAKGMEDTRKRNAAGVPFITRFAYEYADAMLEARGKT